MQPSTPSTTQFLSIASLSLLDSLAFLLIGLRLSWLGAPVAWCWEQAGPHGPSLHLVFLKVLSWLPYYIYSTLLILVISYLPMQTRSFSVVGPKTWNGLPVYLRHLPNGACSQFHHLLKTVLFRLAWVGSASE